MRPNADDGSAACRNKINATTTASWNSGNRTMLRIGAVRCLIMPMVAPASGKASDE